MKVADGCRVFEVIGSSGGGRHPLHVAACVIASSVDRAIAAYLERFPAATIHNVNVKGPETVLLDEEAP
jgi:hypothetical protein